MDKPKPFIEIRESDQYPYPFTKKNGFIYQRGWGNGYVHLPPGHRWHEKYYDNIPVDVHGGLTYGDWDDEFINWVIGFDTSHSGDNLENWPKERVIKETNRLLEQCL